MTESSTSYVSPNNLPSEGEERSGYPVHFPTHETDRDRPTPARQNPYLQLSASSVSQR